MSIQKLISPVVIVGAGPAGAATSIFLSQRGIKHIVIEKETFPRDKVCGDACSGKTTLVLNRANPEWLEQILDEPQAYTPCFGITFVSPNSKQLEIPLFVNRKLGEKATGFTAPRLVFDHFLFKKMASEHCTIFQGAKINTISYGTDEQIVIHMTQNGMEYEITSPIIVGADGDKSIVKKNLHKVQSSPKANSVGLRGYYSGVTGLHPENYIELHFLPEILPGYLWIFPLPNGMANVGVGIASDVVRKRKINLREQMLHAIQHNPNISPRFANATLLDKIQGWGLPICIERTVASGNGYLLTGDAASLIDPFTGEGIGNALYSGMIAAEAIQKALQKKRFDATYLKEVYDDMLYKVIGDEMKLSMILYRISTYPWLLNLMVNKVHKSQLLKDTVSGMLSDVDMREKLRKPSFYFNILFNR